MRGLTTGLAVALLALASLGFASPSDGCLGRWRTASDGGVVEIVRCGPSICGRLVTSTNLLRQPGMRDARNHDAALRTRALKGVLLLSGFSPDASGWRDGRIYNPEDGYTYDARLRLLAPDRLEVKGCVLRLLCKGQVWTRVR